MTRMPVKSLSIVVPVFNEEDNLPLLYEKINSELSKLVELEYEVILVDDGSQDKSPEILASLAAHDQRIRVIFFRRNFGQTAAMSAGFKHARGDVVIPMDADLQNDPVDIARLIKKVNEGYDVVSGHRQRRQDKFLSRVLPSMIANRLISWVSGVPLKDYGCTLKAYRREFVENIKLYGEMHRFIPIYARWQGAKITELPVNHHPRQFGESKYGIIRTFKVLLDLVTVKFLGTFSSKPIYVFGGLGMGAISIGALGAAFSLYQKFAVGAWVHKNPIFTLSIFFSLVGFQFILMGILAEIMIRIYHESGSWKSYWVKSTLNLEDVSQSQKSPISF